MNAFIQTFNKYDKRFDFALPYYYANLVVQYIKVNDEILITPFQSRTLPSSPDEANMVPVTFHCTLHAYLK